MSEQEKEGILVFEPFVRTKFPVLICLFGFSGCGKTLSAIKIAQGLGGKTMFLDTETGRGRVYADDAKGFGYAELTPPFTPERYISAITQIEAAGYDNLLLDSGSHEWDGLGGMLEIADGNVTASGARKTGLGKWSVKSRHKKFMSTLMGGRMNVIICLRAKDKYTQEGVGAKAKITREGFVALQERNFKYDMMVQLPMPEDGEGRYIMDRNAGFKAPAALLSAFTAGQQITEEIGRKISEWVGTGEVVDEAFRQLKKEATESAESGSDKFRSYWKDLPQEQRLKLRPYVHNFESIAKTADAEISGDTEKDNDGNPNIASLSVGVPLVAKKEAKDELTQAIEAGEATTPWTDEENDWLSILDQIRPALLSCENMASYQLFYLDNTKVIESLDKAPESIKAKWLKLVDDQLATFKKK